MLPPSLLAKNRLFVERDPKHRRITSNLGLTFRNSKWSHYARTNVNVNSKNDFLVTTFYSAIVLITTLFLATSFYLYNNYHLLNPLASIYWFAVDSNLYLQLILSSSFFYFIQNLVSWLHAHFITIILRQPTIIHYSETATSVHTLPKRLYKPSLYALLRLSPSTNLLTSIFENTNESHHSLTNLEFIKLLYKTVFLTRLASNSTPFKPLVNFLDNDISSNSTINPRLLVSVSNLRIPTLNSLAFDYTCFNSRMPSSSTLDYRWTLTSVSRTNANFTLTSPKLKGLFYIPSITQGRLNYFLTIYPELSYLRFSVENQMNAIRWNKWLYSYSLLHRSSVKTNAYLNLFKTRLTDVPYDPSLSSRNVWLPESFFSPISDKEILRFNNLYSSLYSNMFSEDFSSANEAGSHFYNKSTLASLSFYESSFNWTLERFYLLNGLSANSISLKPQSRNQSIFNPQTYAMHSNTNLNLTLDLLALSKSVTNKSTLEVLGNTSRRKMLGSPSHFNVEEYSLAYTTANLFSKERLVALSNISSNPSRTLARQNNQLALDTRLLPILPKPSIF